MADLLRELKIAAVPHGSRSSFWMISGWANYFTLGQISPAYAVFHVASGCAPRVTRPDRVRRGHVGGHPG